MPLDYSGQNLQGRSFLGQNLEGANFSSADIRGCDFSGANLRGANFSGAKAGLQKHWVVSLIFLSFLLIGLIGFVIALNIHWAEEYYLSVEGIKKSTVIPGMMIYILTLISTFIAARRGMETAFSATALALAIAGIGIVSGVKASVVVFMSVGGIAGAVFVVLIGAVGGTVIWAEDWSVVQAVAFSWILAGTLFSVCLMIGSRIGTGVLAVVWIGGYALTGGLFTNYCAWLILVKKQQFTLIQQTAAFVISRGGTSFRNANLTEANFQSCQLKSTDFRNANLTRTCWFQAQQLNIALVGTTPIEKLLVQELVTTKLGQDKNFDNLSLRGLNLCSANLADASFIGADLSEANLQDTDLSRAKLVQTQLDGTDLTGATLTGATIEDWHITSNTILQGVRCDYVFMRLPTPEDQNPHRKPDNWNETFKGNDFADFIKPIVDTLDLYHNSNVDPRAIAISFKQLAENHPNAELEIVAMEKRGQDKFLLRAKTAPTADKSELSAEYFTIYNELKALAQQEIKALIAEKDNRIASLETMVVTALQSPSFYAETYNNQGDTMPRRVDNFNLQGAQIAGGVINTDTITAHQIGGNITNYNQVAQTEASNSPAKTILILAANPKTTVPLRLDEEVREIDAGLQRAKKRDRFDLKQRWAVRVQDVYQALLDFKPQIVHFSGHGTDDGLVLEDETGNVQMVGAAALAGLFELFASDIECVVLNACYTFVQASAISQHIPYVIGMRKEVGDKAAIKFATGFYSALGAGESVEFAYKLGCSVIQLDGIAEHLTPVLKKK